MKKVLLGVHPPYFALRTLKWSRSSLACQITYHALFTTLHLILGLNPSEYTKPGSVLGDIDFWIRIKHDTEDTHLVHGLNVDT